MVASAHPRLAKSLPLSASLTVQSEGTVSVRSDFEQDTLVAVARLQQLKQTARHPTGHRAVGFRQDRCASYAFMIDNSAWGFSKNCSSSVEPLSAVVDDSPPWMVCVTASK